MNHIKIDFERIVSNIDCNIFGGYMEIGPSGARYKYLDIGDAPGADKNVLRSDIRTAIERMNLSNIGSLAVISLRDTTGRMGGTTDERPARHDLAWNRTETNNYGTNEFIALAAHLTHK